MPQRLLHDGEVQVKWGIISDDIARNQIQCSFEASALRRFRIVNLSVTPWVLCTEWAATPRPVGSLAARREHP